MQLHIRGDDAHVIKELCPSVSFDVVRIEVTPTKLNVDPELVTICAIEDVLALHRKSETMTKQMKNIYERQ